MKFPKILSTFYILVFSLCQVYSQDTISYVSPVDHIPKLSGNFMELRNNHFHTGIDIKSSKGRVGDRIKSVYKGYVSRVKVQSASYGQVIYIDHPNGYTTVYAHLDSFYEELDQYVKSIQYQTESYEVDLYLPEGLFVLDIGQEIGTMGTTGHSFGPHLHFEIRDTKSEYPLNPEAFGFGPIDKIPPVIDGLYVYNFNERQQTDIARNVPIKRDKSGNKYVNPIEFESDGISFGLLCYDQTSGSYNKNGINSFSIILDDQLLSKWTAENYSFDEARKINGFLDYYLLKNYGIKVYKLFSPQCNALQNYLDSQGIIQLQDDSIHSVQILVSDYYGNSDNLEFKIKRLGKSAKKDSLMRCSESHLFQEGMFQIKFLANSFYNDFERPVIKKSTEVLNGQNCHKLEILNKETAIYRAFEVSCPSPTTDIEKWTFVGYDEKARLVHFGADTLKGRLRTQLNYTGVLFLYKDLVPPTIELISMGDPTRNVAFEFVIKDNLIPDGNVPDLFYRFTVNGKWVRAKYDKKRDLLRIDDFEEFPDGLLQISLIVRDDQGNESMFQRSLMN